MSFHRKRIVMKNILMISLIAIVCAYGQNPDGKFASLHLTPSWQWGKADINRNTSVWLPDAMSYPAQYTTNLYSGTLRFPYAFGIHAQIKVPTTSFLTMSLSYTLNQKFEEDTEYLHYWRLNGNLHRIDLTLSVYNLFSLYQGD